MSETTRTPREVFWTGHIGDRDDFQAPIEDQFIDGATTAGPWAIMNPTSHRYYGRGLGTGLGQRYVKQEDGKWRKVEG